MEFSNKRIAAELLLLIEDGYHTEKLVKWADNIAYASDFEPEIEDLIGELRIINCGEEFYIPVHETMDNIVEILQQEKTTIQQLPPNPSIHRLRRHSGRTDSDSVNS